MSKKIYEVRSIAKSNEKLHTWGARYVQAEAELLLKEQTTGEKKEWADKHHKKWWIEEIDVTGMFEIPSAPKPRDRFSTRTKTHKSTEGAWDVMTVEILDESEEVIATYERNYPDLYSTFEPFRQGNRMYALISTDYTASSVMDLSSGEVIAAEEPHEAGFCPVGFYVPDWWDINDESVLPGSTHWSEDYEQPKGNFGFVWGCIWGDDSSWKVQYLDLSEIQNGKINRDDRFGYISLASHPKLKASDFIECYFSGGKCRVTFSLLESFDLETGNSE